MLHSLRTFIAPITLLAAVLAAAPAFADRHSDDASSDTRDNSLWSERESRRDSGSAQYKVGISQSAVKIMVDGSGGRTGGAAYLSTWKTDWNDSFTVNFTSDFQSSVPSRSSYAAVSGIAFGSDAVSKYSVTSCFKTGVMVQLVETTAGTSVEIIARKRGRLVASTARLPITAGVHQFQVAWIADSATRTVVVELYADSDLSTPILQLSGAERAFEGGPSGISSALFGYSKGNLAFHSSFDDFDYSGDDVRSDDSDDNSWCDDDDHDDDNGGGGGGGGGQIGSSEFIGNLEIAIAANSDLSGAVLKAEVEDGTVEVIFRETSSTVRVVRVSLSTQAVVSTNTRSADEDDLESMSVLNGVTISAASAVAQAAATLAGSTVHEVELEEEDGGPEWSVKLRSPAGVMFERTISAN